jgi:hypothetical protein
VELIIPVEDIPLNLGQPPPDLAREFKPEKAPRLGTDREKGHLPYGTWKQAMLLQLSQAGLLQVIQHTLPREGPMELLNWYSQGTAAALAALISAVKHLPFAGEIYGCVGHPWGARLAWFLIKDRHLAKSPYSLINLEQRLAGLTPAAGEKMDSFLQRAVELQDQWRDYDMRLPDIRLVTQIMSHLPYTWWTQCGITQAKLETITFEELSALLRVEDNARAAAPLTVSPEYKPLGWQKELRPSAAHAAVGQPGPKEQGEDTPKTRSVSKTTVCYCCKKAGHSWTKCWTLPHPDWSPTDQDVEEARARKHPQEGGSPKRAEPLPMLEAQEGGSTGGG